MHNMAPRRVNPSYLRKDELQWILRILYKRMQSSAFDESEILELLRRSSQEPAGAFVHTH